MIYTKKMYKEALMVSSLAHKNQTYDSMFPYMKHIHDVIEVLKRFGFTNYKYLIAAALHDAMEDNGLPYKDIKNYFGEEIAEIVYSVTDEMGRDRLEKKIKTLPKTAKCPDGIIIKLGDRIANIEHGGKVGMYKKEFEEFKLHLLPNTPIEGMVMWAHLKELLEITE